MSFAGQTERAVRDYHYGSNATATLPSRLAINYFPRIVQGPLFIKSNQKLH